jgi:hypothetical protein
MKTTLGYALVAAGLVFGWTSTAKFGNNWLPSSLEEAVCDSITFVMVFSGYYLAWRK